MHSESFPFGSVRSHLRHTRDVRLCKAFRKHYPAFPSSCCGVFQTTLVHPQLTEPCCNVCRSTLHAKRRHLSQAELTVIIKSFQNYKFMFHTKYIIWSHILVKSPKSTSTLYPFPVGLKGSHNLWELHSPQQNGDNNIPNPQPLYPPNGLV